jgi:hypothetical protein
MVGLAGAEGVKSRGCPKPAVGFKKVLPQKRYAGPTRGMLLWVINTSRDVRVMSVIPLKADIHLRGLHVCLVPKADISDSSATFALSALPPANRRRLRLRLRVIFLVLKEDWFESFLRPKVRRADFSQAGVVPI